MATYISRSVATRNHIVLNHIFSSYVLITRDRNVRCLCNASDSGTEVPGFQDARVQGLLKRITGLNLEKIFRASKETLEPPSYKLISTNKLREMRQEATEKAAKRLQMPPVLEEREAIDEVLAEDPALAGLESSNLVFTDITYGLNDRKRLVVVRQPNGTLRKASWEERDRIMQIYFPRERREIEVPPMFTDDRIPIILANELHEFLLDAVCVQFEPDAAQSLRIHRKVYEDLDKTGKYDLLRSTRHFGGMAYYLVRHKRIDGLLTEMIQRDLFDDAVDLVNLYNLLHPTSSLANETRLNQLDGGDLIKAYIKLESHHSGQLELALQAWENERTDAHVTSATE